MPEELPGLPALYTEDEIAEYLGCSVRTLRDKRRAKAISHVRVGGRVRYRAQDILEYLELETVPAKNPRSQSQLPDASTAQRLSKKKSSSLRTQRLRETKALHEVVRARMKRSGDF